MTAVMDDQVDTDTDDRLLRLAEVKARTSLGTTTIYRLMNDGKFPASVKLGSIVRWRLSEIRRWMDAIPRSREVKEAIDADA